MLYFEVTLLGHRTNDCCMDVRKQYIMDLAKSLEENKLLLYTY